MTQTPSARLEELVQSSAPDLWRGFVTVVVARDPPPDYRSRAGKLLSAVALGSVLHCSSSR